MTLAEINDKLGVARTNKKEFFEKLKRIIPWRKFIKLIEPHYYKVKRENKPYPLELMLQIFILQNVYNLADMVIMNEIIDRRALSNFRGINSPNEVPDDGTIGRFCTLLTKYDLQEKIFATVVKILMERHLILNKGDTWHFWYKAYISVDETNGLIQTVKTTATNEHNIIIVSQLLYGEE